MERWIQIHYQIKEREEAVQLARTRELFYWLSGFYAISIFSTIWYYKRFKRPETILPILPLTFVVGYYADIAYGSKLNRIKGKSIRHLCVHDFKYLTELTIKPCPAIL